MRRLAVSLALCLTTAAAQAVTGNELLHMMEAKDDPTLSLAVMAYIRGFSDASAFSMDTLRRTKEGAIVNGQFFCVPPAATAEQMRDLVRIELEAQPAQRHLVAGIFVYRALRRAWPCPD